MAEYDQRQTILIKPNADKNGQPGTEKYADLKGTITDAAGNKFYADLWLHMGKWGPFYSGHWRKPVVEQPRGNARPAYEPPVGYQPNPPIPFPPAQQPPQQLSAQKAEPVDPDLELVRAVCPDGVVRDMPRGTARGMGFFIEQDNAPWERPTKLLEDVPQ